MTDKNESELKMANQPVKAVKKDLDDTLYRIVVYSQRDENLDKKEERKKFLELKELLVDFEATNYQYIVFYRRDEGWWQTGDNSMLIYFYLLCARANSKMHIWPDRDYTKKKWKHGMVMAKGLATVERRMREEKCRLVAETNSIRVFMLPKSVSDEDIAAWSNVQTAKEEAFNRLIMPTNIYPKMMNMARALMREVTNRVNNLTEPQRQLFGHEGAELAMGLVRDGIGMANGRIAPKEYLEQSLVRLGLLREWLGMVSDFKVFGIEASARMAYTLMDLEKDMKKELEMLGGNKPRTAGKKDKK